MSYGFCCAYCDRQLDTPHDGHDLAEQTAQAAGWRITCGPSSRWGEGAHNTCPDCIPINAMPGTVIPIYVSKGCSAEMSES